MVLLYVDTTNQYYRNEYIQSAPEVEYIEELMKMTNVDKPNSERVETPPNTKKREYVIVSQNQIDILKRVYAKKGKEYL